MARPLRVQYPDALYHITCRGIERRKIFETDKDREKILEYLALSREIYGAKVYGFVLMSNHFHLLVMTPKANLSEFMRHFNISYTAYFNKRYSRSGNLYQGRYKSLLVEEELYLNKLLHYIHLNPVWTKSKIKEEIKDKLEYIKNYRWSTLSGYLNKKKRYDFVSYDYVMEMYGGANKKGIQLFLNEMTYSLLGKEVFDIKKETIGQAFLTSKEFAKAVIKKTDEVDEREITQKKRIAREIFPEEIVGETCRAIGVAFENIRNARGVYSWILMDMLYRFGKMSQVEIGRLLNKDYSTVSVSRKRLRKKMEKDKRITTLYKKIDNILISQE